MRRATAQRGFTLVELASVIVVTAVLAATAAPVLSRVADTRRAVLGEEVERVLVLVRSRALSAGHPAGLEFDVASNTMTPVELPDSLGAPRAFTEVYEVAQRHPGALIASVTTEERTDSVWFAPDGVPHLRDPDGDFLSYMTTEASIVIQNGPTVRIEPTSGRVLR